MTLLSATSQTPAITGTVLAEGCWRKKRGNDFASVAQHCWHPWHFQSVITQCGPAVVNPPRGHQQRTQPPVPTETQPKNAGANPSSSPSCPFWAPHDLFSLCWRACFRTGLRDSPEPWGSASGRSAAGLLGSGGQSSLTGGESHRGPLVPQAATATVHSAAPQPPLPPEALQPRDIDRGPWRGSWHFHLAGDARPSGSVSRGHRESPSLPPTLLVELLEVLKLARSSPRNGFHPRRGD